MIIASIQARMGSTRAPGKVLREISGKPLIQHVYDRLSQSKKIDKVVIATSINPKDDELVKYAQSKGVDIYRGSEEDLWERHLGVAEAYGAHILVRICGDCPFIDSEIIDRAIDVYQNQGAAFVSNRSPKTYPVGMDFEIYNVDSLKRIVEENKGFYRRYPFQYILDNGDEFITYNIEVEGDEDYSNIHLTVDYPEDFVFAEKIYDALENKDTFNFVDVISIVAGNPEFGNEVVNLPRGQEFAVATEKSKSELEIQKLIEETAGFDVRALLEWSSRTYGEEIVFASSFGAEDMVLIDFIGRLHLPIKIITLDTGRLPVETYTVIEQVKEKYGLKVEIHFPDKAEVEKMVNEKGLFSFRESIENRRECCLIRKVQSLRGALQGKRAWITGLRRAQSVTREDLPKIERDSMFKIIKINPLFRWSEQDVWNYIKHNNVPYNALHDKGFASIGCEPCTRPIEKGEDVRAGRWWWENPEHKECGLHLHKTT